MELGHSCAGYGRGPAETWPTLQCAGDFNILDIYIQLSITPFLHL